MKKVKDFFEKIIKMTTLKRANLRLEHAIKMADTAHERDGDRYFVMPDHRDRLIIMRRKTMRKWRRHGIMSSDVKMDNMMCESFYFTPDRGESHGLSPAAREAKRLMYLEYALHKRGN